LEAEGVRVRVRVGNSEIEVESPKPLLDEVIEKAESLLLRMSEVTPVPARGHEAPKVPVGHEPTALDEMPQIVIEKGDSLGDILLKLFTTPWGSTPRRLGEILETLRSYGAIYPKSSVAVSLLRMVHAGKLRRFKEDGGYVYVSATPLASTAGQPMPSE
jgi:hypothetical protein